MAALFKTKSRKERDEQKKAEDLKKKDEQKKNELANPSSRFAPTQVVYADLSFEHPPPLNYTLRTRKKSLFIFWGLIFLDCICMPLILYFVLWYCTNLSHNAVFSISTGALGSVSIFEYFLRFRRLWKKGSTCRVIGARRYYVGQKKRTVRHLNTNTH
jgi:hypothetical protein